MAVLVQIDGNRYPYRDIPFCVIVRFKTIFALIAYKQEAKKMKKIKVVGRIGKVRKSFFLNARRNQKTRIFRIPAKISQQRGANLRLELFSDINFEGFRLIFDAGEVALRDMRLLNYNDVLSSFRFRNSGNRRNVSLVLFRDINYQGSFQVFRGSRSIANLVKLGFNDQASSLVFVARRISNSRIRRIQKEAQPPGAVLEISS